MIIDVVTVEPSSSCLKVCIVMDQRDVGYVEEKRKESCPPQASGSKDQAFTAPTMVDTDGKTIIQYRR